METTSCIIQDSERLKQDAIDKAHIESMSDYIKIPKIAFFYSILYLSLLFEITFILISQLWDYLVFYVFTFNKYHEFILVLKISCISLFY